MKFQVPQDSAAPEHTVVIPPDDPVPAAAAPAPIAAPRVIAETAAPKLGEREVPEPPVGGLFAATAVIAVLAAAAWLVFRRFLKGSRLFQAQGVIQVLGRRAVAPRQEVLLVEVAGRVFLVGSTRERLSTLGEISRPEEVSAIRARVPGSAAAEFKAALADAPAAPKAAAEPETVPAGAYDGLARELAQIRRSVQAWKD